MSYLGRRRKPAQPKAKNAQKRHLRVVWKKEAPFTRPASMQFDPISNEWNVIDREPTKVTEHGECRAVWRDEAKDLTLWAKFVKWVRGWHG